MQTEKRILAGIVLACITLIAVTQIRTTAIQTRTFLDEYTKDSSKTLTTYAKTINEAYRAILKHNEGIPIIDRGAYINLNGFMANAMNQKFANDVVKLRNGHLARLQKKGVIDKNLITQVVKLSNWQKERGKQFLFVLAPYQFSNTEDALPAGYEDFSEANADDLLAALRRNDVSVLHLREKMYEQNLNGNDIMFKTDHHWTWPGAFWGYTEMIKYLEENNSLPQNPDANISLHDVINLENYIIETYRNVWIGSDGKRIGKYYNGMDDFQHLFPIFNTNLNIDISAKNINKTGSIKDIYTANPYDPNKEIRIFTDNLYNLIGHWNQGIVRYTNPNAPLDTKILMYSDSFGLAVEPFMSMTSTNFDIITNNSYKESFEEYITNYDPDIMIFLLYTRYIPGNDYLNYNFLPSYNTEVK